MDARKPGLMPLGERIAEALSAETHPEEQLRVARLQLLERVTSTPRRAPKTSKRLRYAGLAALAALALTAVLTRSFTQPISFVTDAHDANLGDRLEAAARRPLKIDFSDGSRMLLRAGSRARVLETHAAGARVLLESGVADVSIVHRDSGTRWRFEAGPFQVLVKGTQFQLDWQPAAQTLLLKMKSGRVEVLGSCLAVPRSVERGDSLRVSCANPAAPEPALDAHAQAKSAPAAAPSPPSDTSKRPATSELSAAHRTFEAMCQTAGKAELADSANRERLAGHVSRARTALIALRRRFAGSSEATTAAFTLGRMAFDQQASYREAARWFAIYLAEQPNGPLVGDAAGRLLEAHERQGDQAAARRDAGAYLRRFPEGPYAARARRIVAP